MSETTTGALRGAVSRAEHFRENEKLYRTMAAAEALPALRDKYLDAAASYARLAAAEDRMVRGRALDLAPDELLQA